MAKKQPYVYGRSPHPRNWHQAAEALESIKPTKKRKSGGLMDRIGAIEKLLKDHKNGPKY